MFTLIIFFLFIRLLVSAYKFRELDKAFLWFGVVPNVIMVPPKQFATVEYPLLDVNLGNEIRPVDVSMKPLVSWEANFDKFYTLVMVDPDEASDRDPVTTVLLHWLVGNIPGSLVIEGAEIFPYHRPYPKRGGVFHRYVFLIYEQPMKYKFKEPRINTMDSKTRVFFSVEKFARRYQLGDPVAGNFFLSKYTPKTIAL